jgi:hypothetical protein
MNISEFYNQFASCPWPVRQEMLIEFIDALTKEREELKAKVQHLEWLVIAHVRTQQCAHCGEEKPTPYRRDDLGGYVCLTCVEKYLDKTLDERDQLKAQLDALKEALEKIANYPVHSEPVGGSYAMQDIAHEALKQFKSKHPDI